MKRTYDGTVARIAGNILSRIDPADFMRNPSGIVQWAVEMARLVVVEVQRTEPEPEETGK